MCPLNNLLGLKIMDRRYKRKMQRYWEREIKNTMASIDNRDFSKWFDHWHTHIDWKSKGNKFPESRATVAKMTYDLLLYAEAAGSNRKEPIQFFATVCQDTGSNAVYIHTENPNGTEFPTNFADTEWGCEAPIELLDVLDIATHELGRTQYEDEAVYVIRKKT